MRELLSILGTAIAVLSTLQSKVSIRGSEQAAMANSESWQDECRLQSKKVISAIYKKNAEFTDSKLETLRIIYRI